MYNDDGDTPLLFAVKENDVQAVSILVQDARVNVNIKDVDGFDVIQLASSNRTEILRILLQGPAFELVDDNALQIAVRAGCVACVDLLLDFDVNVDDAMPLYRGPRSILKLLLDAGADAETALLVNVQQERYADIEWLLRRGVRVTPQVLFIASRDPMLTAVLHNGRSSEVIGG
jgi:ankyrin repeat protein